MTIWEIVLAGIALSMDAFAVSIADGIAAERVQKRFAFGIALTFGLFQAFMPIAGYALVAFCGAISGTVYDMIHRADKWVALILLGILGGKMIIESLFGGQEQEVGQLTPLVILGQGVATSIDALAIGISLGASGGGIFLPAVIIGAETAVICSPAVYLGKRLRFVLGKWANIAAGVVLICIGSRIFMDRG